MEKAGLVWGEIRNMQLCRIQTGYAKEIIDALKKSAVRFSAKYDDTRITLAYDIADKEKAVEILEKVSSENARLIERIRKNESNGGYEVLIPEIAGIMGISAAALSARPNEIVELLAKTYIDLWFCDKTTIRNALYRITELDSSVMGEMKEEIQPKEQNNDESRSKGSLFTREMLKNEAERIRKEISDSVRADAEKFQ